VLVKSVGKKILSAEIRKGPWSGIEDEILLEVVQKQIRSAKSRVPVGYLNAADVHKVPTTPSKDVKSETDMTAGSTLNDSSATTLAPMRINWRLVASVIPGRTAKQCRARWVNNLNPSLRKDSWTKSEDDTIIRLRNMVGPRWAYIASQLDGRSENSVKIRCTSLMRHQQPILTNRPAALSESYQTSAPVA